MTAPPCAEECRRVLIEIAAANDTEVHATWVPPLFPTGYEPLDMTCRHGVLWYMEPTSEQRARYAADAGSTTVALLLAALWMLGFVGLVLVGQGAVCEAQPEVERSYCAAGR